MLIFYNFIKEKLYTGLFVLPRILYAIAKDGLLCPLLAKVNYKTQVKKNSVLCLIYYSKVK